MSDMLLLTGMHHCCSGSGADKTLLPFPCLPRALLQPYAKQMLDAVIWPETHTCPAAMQANVRLLEERLPVLCDSVSAQGANQQAISAGYYAAAAHAAAAAGARSGRQSLLAFSCVGRGKALYEGFGAQESEAQEACLMDDALAGQGPFWGAYVVGELGPQQLHGSGCGFAGRMCVEGGAEAGPVSHLAYSSVIVALGASPS